MPFNGVNSHSIVIMYICSIHNLERVAQKIHSTGALLKFLPPYSLDLNRIELVFSKAKAFIKANYVIAQSIVFPHLMVSFAFNTIQPLRWWSNCCKSRKCIRGHIPMHAIFCHFLSIFLTCSIYRLCTNKTQDLINARKFTF